MSRFVWVTSWSVVQSDGFRYREALAARELSNAIDGVECQMKLSAHIVYKHDPSSGGTSHHVYWFPTRIRILLDGESQVDIYDDDDDEL